MEDKTLKNAYRATQFIFLAFGLGISCLAPIIPFVKTKLAVNDAELGMILFMSGIGALISMPLAGCIVPKFGTRLTTAIFSILVCILLPLLTFANTPALMSFILFFFGMCTGFWNVSINAHAVLVEIKAKASIMSGLHCFFSAGGLCGAIIVSSLLNAGLGLLLSVSIVSLIMSLMIVSNWKNLLPNEKKNIPSAANNHKKKKLSLPGIKVFILGTACFFSFMTEGSILDWSAEFLRSTYHYSTENAGIGYAIFSVGMILGRYTGDSIIRMLGTLFTFQSSCFVTMSGLIIAIAAPWSNLELAGFFLVGLGASNIVPILFSSSGRVESSSSELNLTVVTSFGYLGLLFGPASIGYIAQASSLSFAFLCIAALLLIVGASGGYILRGLIPSQDVREEKSF